MSWLEASGRLIVCSELAATLSLAVALLLAVLRVLLAVALLWVLVELVDALLLVIGAAILLKITRSVLLAGLKGGGTGLERSGTRPKGVCIYIEVLLGLLGEIVVLRGSIFP